MLGKRSSNITSPATPKAVSKHESGVKHESSADELWGSIELRMKEGEDSTSHELRGGKTQIVGRSVNVDICTPLPHVSATHMTIRQVGFDC